MANITRRDDRGTIRTMRDLLRWDPFGQMMPYGEQQLWTPQFEVRESTDSFIFKADLPGIKKDDVDIQLHHNRLTVSGKREQEHEEKEGDTVYAYERSFGSFSRSFTLPENADTEHVKCDLKEGVLTMVIPKKAGAQPRKIPIGSEVKS